MKRKSIVVLMSVLLIVSIFYLVKYVGFQYCNNHGFDNDSALKTCLIYTFVFRP
jgi:hypothetical protein